MPLTFRLAAVAALLAAALGTTGCATTTIEPGHRGLLFAPRDGGLKREVLQPGYYKLGWCFIGCTSSRIDDFDVTYTTKAERLQVRSSEGLDLDLGLSVIYRPIVSELYQLDTEIGPGYYAEVIGPEFRSVCRSVLARHSYVDLQRGADAIQDEVEADLRRRIAGRHVEIASVTLERVAYAPEIAEAVRQRLAAAEEARRRQAAEEIEFAHKKREIERDNELRKLRATPACGSATVPGPESSATSARTTPETR
jgi:regulator of protease activity HflC (stomatin/prohibitin superfamily)